MSPSSMWTSWVVWPVFEAMTAPSSPVKLHETSYQYPTGASAFNLHQSSDQHVAALSPSVQSHQSMDMGSVTTVASLVTMIMWGEGASDNETVSSWNQSGLIADATPFGNDTLTGNLNNSSATHDSSLGRSSGSGGSSGGQFRGLSDTAKIFIVILYSVTAAFAFLGNLIVVLVLWAGKRSSPELKKFLINLAAADILMGVFSIPFTYTDFVYQRWFFPLILCKLVQYIQVTSVFVSVYTLVVIGFDRYLAIMFPLRTSHWVKSRSTGIMCSIWVFGSMLGYCMFHNSEAVEKRPGIYDCTETWDPTWGKIYAAFLFVLTFLLPISLISVVYGRIGYTLIHRKAPGETDQTRDEHQAAIRYKIIKMLLAVVIAFGFCWAPLQIFNMLLSFCEEFMFQVIMTMGYKFYLNMFIFCHWLAMAHSCVNPVIYCFMSDSFRADLRELLHRMWRCICYSCFRRVRDQNGHYRYVGHRSLTQMGSNSIQMSVRYGTTTISHNGDCENSMITHV